jgi:hypothetical protein
MQTVIAYFIVAIASIYAAWLFIPRAARRWLIGRLILIAPSLWRTRLTRLQTTAESDGCSTCKGCETNAKEEPEAKPIRLHRR